MDTKLVSPYSEGARRGVIFGIIFSIIFLCMVWADYIPLSGLIMAALFIVAPILLYRFLRITYITDGGFTTFAGLWTQGIMMYGCGALICALVTVTYLRFFDPTFLHDMVEQAINLYRQSDDKSLAEMADMLQNLQANHAIPTPMEFAFNLTLFTTLSGSLLSMLAAMIVIFIPIRSRSKNTIKHL